MGSSMESYRSCMGRGDGMGNDIQPIETKYNGYKFRSRLEARWAVFFETAGIRYEYEPEGFKTKSGLCYLPDFYLPDEDMYVEVKANRKGAWKEIVKAIKVIRNSSCLMILSEIPPDTCKMWAFPVLYFHPVNRNYMIRHLPFVYGHYGIQRVIIDREAPEIGENMQLEAQIEEFGTCGENYDEELQSKLINPLPDLSGGMTWYYYSGRAKKNVFVVLKALQKARQARFEFGSKG